MSQFLQNVASTYGFSCGLPDSAKSTAVIFMKQLLQEWNGNIKMSLRCQHCGARPIPEKPR